MPMNPEDIPAANLPRPRPPSRPFTLFGHLLGEEVRLEMVARGGKSHLALLVSGMAHSPQGSWPEATIRIELSPLRLRLLAESLRVCAEDLEHKRRKRRKRRAAVVVRVPGPPGPQGVSR